MNIEVARAAVSLLCDGEDFAWTTIVDSRGSTPRHAGADMLVRADGSIVGTVGGGPLEAAAIKAAREVLASGVSRLVDYDSADLGMMCGGGNRALIEHVTAGNPATKTLHDHLLQLLENGGRGWLVTAIDEEPHAGLKIDKWLVDLTGSVWGDPTPPDDALRELVQRGGTYDGLVASRPSSKMFVRPVGANGKAFVFGAGHCGEKLVPVLSNLGFFTTVVDDRAEFADEDRFPAADRIVVPGSFEGAVQGLAIDEDSFIVIVTRGHSHDRTVLEQALRTPARYIGMIGSRRKVAGVFTALHEEGFSEQDLARVHAPIGLSIGAETPEEIAISIAAEMVQVRACK